ncbi:MAG: GatB/YqeY domain-containing protein [Crocinitomicaceae bacterium]|nr:GatB/YqeY domain-containing protein [Crocinitomicaceae bacterium]
MALTEQINNDIKEAMKAREKEKLEALRDIKSKLLLEATSGSGEEISEATENKIILKMHKQRMDAYAIYVDQGREDLAKDELFQAQIIEAYMPKMLSEEEVKAAVEAVIAAVGASGPQDMGKVMGTVTKKLAGKADGKTLADMVKALLNN